MFHAFLGHLVVSRALIWAHSNGGYMLSPAQSVQADSRRRRPRWLRWAGLTLAVLLVMGIVDGWQRWKSQPPRSVGGVARVLMSSAWSVTDANLFGFKKDEVWVFRDNGSLWE